MSAPYGVQHVEHLGDYRLRLTFADGLVTEIDLTEKLAGLLGLFSSHSGTRRSSRR
jgi:hypothetical protein